jgi:hypothetical protein
MIVRVHSKGLVVVTDTRNGGLIIRLVSQETAARLLREAGEIQ